MIPGSCPVISGGANDYKAKGVSFNGSTDYLTRASALAGVSNGKQATLSFWYRVDAAPTGNLIFTINNTEYVSAQSTLTTNLVDVRGLNSSGTLEVHFAGSTAMGSGATWHHLIISWDLSVPTASYYVDGVSQGAAGTLNNAAINYVGTNLAVAALPGGTAKLQGSLSDIWFDPTTYFDLSVATNMQKFRDTLGKPVSLNSDGSGPTGVQPALYLTGPASTVNVNNGSGGDFVIHGTPSDASSSPSD